MGRVCGGFETKGKEGLGKKDWEMEMEMEGRGGVLWTFGGKDAG